MDWARTSQGRLVYAPDLTYPLLGLSCPKCGAPVFLRRGRDRRPHFAHLSHRARPDCEDYYPSAGDLGNGGISRGGKKALLSPRPGSLQFGLFLIYRADTGQFGLWLRVPCLPASAGLAGSLIINSGAGRKVLDAAGLAKPQSVKLALTRIPLAECTGSGDLVELARHVTNQTDSFGSGINLFLQTEAGARYLSPGEPAEWGASYWALSALRLQPPEGIAPLIGWEPSGHLDGWHVYNVTLPSHTSSAHPELETRASAFLGRSIKAARPRAYVVEPYPHHISEDGAYVYPGFPAKLYVRRTANQKVSLESHTRLPACVLIKDLSEEWVLVTDLDSVTGEFALSIDHVDQAILRAEPCDLFCPPGLEVNAGGYKWSLTEDAPLDSDQLALQTTSVECKNPRIAQHLAKLNRDWVEDDSVLSAPVNCSKMFRGGAFGGIWHRRPTTRPVATEFPRPFRPSPRAIWLSGLIGARCGQQALTLFHNYLNNPSAVALCKLWAVLPPELMPYVRAEKSF